MSHIHLYKTNEYRIKYRMLLLFNNIKETTLCISFNERLAGASYLHNWAYVNKFEITTKRKLYGISCYN